MTVKGLDTGYARDVSGVLMLNRGPGAETAGDAVEEQEYLYSIEADGGAKVFERGS